MVSFGLFFYQCAGFTVKFHPANLPVLARKPVEDGAHQVGCDNWKIGVAFVNRARFKYRPRLAPRAIFCVEQAQIELTELHRVRHHPITDMGWPEAARCPETWNELAGAIAVGRDKDQAVFIHRLQLGSLLGLADRAELDQQAARLAAGCAAEPLFFQLTLRMIFVGRLLQSQRPA